MGLSCLFNRRFLGLTLGHRNAVTWASDWHASFSLIYTLINIDTPPFPFFNRGAFLLGAAFCPSSASI
jgi:hypothetical protein